MSSGAVNIRNNNSTGSLAFDPYSDAQKLALNWSSAPSAFLSFVCSALIISHAFRSRARQKLTTYHRLVIGLSIFDIISSISIFSGSFFFQDMDEPTSQCNVNGFLQFLSLFAAALYNTALSIMFLLIVRFDISDQVLQKYYEPIFHFVAIVPFFIIAVFGLFAQVYNPVFGVACWLYAYPYNCIGDECERGGEWAGRYQVLLVATFWVVGAILTLANISIYCKVRNTVNRSQRHLTASVRGSSNTSLNRGATTPSKSQQVARRSLLFCGGYGMVYCFGFFADLTLSDENLTTWWHYTLVVLASIFYPLQGFFDFLVYFRNRYLKWRRVCPRDSIWFAIIMSTLTTLPAHRSHSALREVTNFPVEPPSNAQTIATVGTNGASGFSAGIVGDAEPAKNGDEESTDSKEEERRFNSTHRTLDSEEKEVATRFSEDSENLAEAENNKSQILLQSGFFETSAEL